MQNDWLYDENFKNDLDEMIWNFKVFFFGSERLNIFGSKKGWLEKKSEKEILKECFEWDKDIKDFYNYHWCDGF